MHKQHSGNVTPLVTPAADRERADHEALRRITGRVVEAGSHVLVLGTTGEAPSIGIEERERIVKTVVDTVSGRTKVYAGIGSPRPPESLSMGRRYLELGADAVVAHPPYYYALDGDDLLRHYTWLADNLPGPLVLYNIPATTKISIPFDTIVRLSEHPNIIGMKDSERDAERQRVESTYFRDREDFAFFTGVGTVIADALAWGADGGVPASSNIDPVLYQELYEAARQGDEDRARALQAEADRLSGVYQEGWAPNKVLPALKVVLESCGLCGPAMFPPLSPLNDEEKRRVLKKLADYRREGKPATAPAAETT